MRRSTILLVLLAAVTLAGACAAQDKPAQVTSRMHWAISFDGDYFTGRRQEFRQIYGHAAGAGIDHEFHLTGPLHLHNRLGVLYGTKSLLKTHYWEGTLASVIKAPFYETRRLRFAAGVGPGVGFRIALFGKGDSEVRQHETAPLVRALLGCQLKLGGSVMVSGTMLFDRYLGRSGTRGYFGDTGGYHLLLGVGGWG